MKKTNGSTTSLYPFGDDYEVTNGVTTKYISVEGLGVVAKKVTGGSNPGTFWIHTDRLGSIDAVTKADGSIAFQRLYRPYGETFSRPSSHTESRGWIDQRNDTETGLTYLHARYFDPQLGTFLSPDPIGVAGGMSQYAYAQGDPVNGTDRSGLVLDQCYDDPDPNCRIRLIAPGADGGQASNPGRPGFSFSAVGPAAMAGGAGSGLLAFLFDKIFGFFGSQSNNAPRDPSVPPSTAYVSGKHIDPYSDYEEPGPDSLVSLVPTAGTPTGGNGGSGGGSGGGEGGGGTGGGGTRNPGPTGEWWAEYFKALPGAAFDEFGDDGCAAVFFEGMRGSLMPFTLSAASFADPAAYSWGAFTGRETVARAVALRGAGAPMRDPVYAGLRRAAGARAASGPLLALNAAIATGLYDEFKAMASGQCR